jgi:hypothetical protein
LHVLPERRIVRRSLAENLLSCVRYQREDSEVLAFGQAAHSFFAAYKLQCMATGEQTRLTDVARLAAEAWARTHGLDQNRYAEFMRLAEQWASARPTDLDTLMRVEHTETLDVGFAILTGTMDEIDRADLGDEDDEPTRELIVDEKTAQGEMDSSFQGMFYVQLRFINHPALQEVGWQVYPVRNRWPDETTWYRRGELDLWWKTMLTALRDRLEHPDGEPTGGKPCTDCAIRYECPKALAVARAIPETEEQADELFGEALRMQEAFEVRKAGLLEFYRGREPRVAAGHEVGFLTPRDAKLVVTAKPLDLRAWLNKHHMDGDSVLKVDSEVVGKSAIADKLVVAGLATREHSKPGFRWRKYVPARTARDKARGETNAEVD